MTQAKNKKIPSRKFKKQFSQAVYEIKVQGQLDELWAHWFEGMTLTTVENGESGLACTLISGPVADQPALHGLLIKIRDLNLTLISVCRISPLTNVSEEISVDFLERQRSD
jgi:hypothetical protein